MTPVTGTFSLASPGDLIPAVSNKPLGDASLNATLASGQVQSPVHLAGALPVEFTFHAGAALTVVALNGKNGPDPSGVIAAADEKTPEGAFEPLLRFDGTAGWLKYSASADVKAEAGADSSLLKFTGSAGTSVVSADYHRHALGDGILPALVADLSAVRSAIVLDHVRNLPAGDALTFETAGTLDCSLDIAWSDVLTSEIGALTDLLRVAAPIGIHLQTGATCSVRVSLTDAFVVAFARPMAGGALRLAVRKGAAREISAGAAVGVTATVDDPAAIELVLDNVVAGLLGTSTVRLDALRHALAGGSMTADSTALAAAIVERLKLPGADAIVKTVDHLRTTVSDRLKALVEAKVEGGFAYQYHRVSSDVAIFEAEIPSAGPGADLHREIMTGNLAAAFSRGPSDISVKRFLNERTTTMRQAWGFTLGFGKWKVFGQDRRALTSMTRSDAASHTLLRSYVGLGGYARTNLSWSADFAADMSAWSPRPLVREYRFGLHLAWTRDPQPFTDGDLEAALDFAALWSICPEGLLAWLREQLSDALHQRAEWSFHVRVNDEALRPMLRRFGSMLARDLAGPAAAALAPDRMASTSERRRTYTPLWQAALASPAAFDVDNVARRADTLLGSAELGNRERQAAERHAYDPTTVAGIVAYDTDWIDDAARFLRGCRLLADAIDTSAADTGTIPDAYRQLVRFWTQSHYVRTLGAALVETASAVGQIKGVERTLRLAYDGEPPKTAVVVSSKMFQA